MRHAELTEELSEQIISFALGAPDRPAAKQFEEHLGNCPLCRQQLDEMRSTMALLAYGLPTASPSAEVKTRLLERVQASSKSVGTPKTIDFEAVDWQPSEFSGTSFHFLRQDESTGTLAALVKIEPGCSYPAHLHPGGEDCLVLKGAFRDRRGKYCAGDFIHYEPGSEHHDIQALDEGECILFVIAHGGLEMLPTQV